jgi:hypothetical protein
MFRPVLDVLCGCLGGVVVGIDSNPHGPKSVFQRNIKPFSGKSAFVQDTMDKRLEFPAARAWVYPIYFKCSGCASLQFSSSVVGIIGNSDLHRAVSTRSHDVKILRPLYLTHGAFDPELASRRSASCRNVARIHADRVRPLSREACSKACCSTASARKRICREYPVLRNVATRPTAMAYDVTQMAA